jgi:hypothetical protein
MQYNIHLNKYCTIKYIDAYIDANKPARRFQDTIPAESNIIKYNFKYIIKSRKYMYFPVEIRGYKCYFLYSIKSE